MNFLQRRIGTLAAPLFACQIPLPSHVVAKEDMQKVILGIVFQVQLISADLLLQSRQFEDLVHLHQRYYSRLLFFLRCIFFRNYQLVRLELLYGEVELL